MARLTLVGVWSLLLTGESWLVAEQYDAAYGTGKCVLTVATGSPGELGLLEALAQAFNKRHNATIRLKKAGSGMALRLLHDKKVDVALVHAPDAERRAVDEGWAADRTLIGCNQFFIVGPKDDPAGIAKARSAVEAFQRIAKAKALFLSRGDNSGTHKKELAIWEHAGIVPSGAWYVATRDFMLASLRQANDRGGYFMTDSSTWFTARAEMKRLNVLFRGDPMLVNIYHGLCQAPDPGEPPSLGSIFTRYLSSEEAQTIIRNFGKDRYGSPLYGDAKQARAGAAADRS